MPRYILMTCRKNLSRLDSCHLSNRITSSQWWVCGNMSTGMALTGTNGLPFILLSGGLHKLWIKATIRFCDILYLHMWQITSSVTYSNAVWIISHITQTNLSIQENYHIHLSIRYNVIWSGTEWPNPLNSQTFCKTQTVRWNTYSFDT